MTLSIISMNDESCCHYRRHPYVHSEESLKKISNHLYRIEGYIRGIIAMAVENCPCSEILLQLVAVREAIERLS